MKHFFLILFVIIFVNAKSQISTNPEFPVATNSVILTFDATGSDLEGYTGDVYAHTGVTIEGQGQWKHVIGSWANNSTQPQLTSLGNNKWELEISPSINDFYNVSGGEIVTELCIVFRSADSETQSADLFVDVYSTTLDITFSKPDTTKIYSLNDIVEIQAVSLAATSMQLFINDVNVSNSSTNNISYSHTIDATGNNTIKIIATDGTDTEEKTIDIFVRSESQIAELPSSNLIDGINYIDDNTVTLVLFAPFKNFAFVKGSFNNWEITTDNQMFKTSDGNRYWITLNGLTAGQEYIYQYIVDGEITIADPYADKISDPWNDHYISNATYPNLIDYPTGKTSGIASVFQTAQTTYNWQINNFTKPANEDLVIYELHIRDFIASHNYQTMIDTINYLKDLGINVIELMPIDEFEGNSSWGYNPSFYFAPDKYYGTKNKLKEFIDVCHQNEIAVINDIVLNHSFGQSPFVQLYFDPDAGDYGEVTAENPWYNVHSPNTDYSWGYDFNHESPDTKQLVSRIVKYWLNEYKFDGFRFDFTKGFTNTIGNGWAYDASRIQILEDIADTIWQTSTGAYMICEHLTDNSEEKVLAEYGIMLWGNITHSYAQASMGYTDDWDFSWASYQKRGWENANLVSYMESHDEERMMFKNITYGNSLGDYNVKDEDVALKRAELAAAFFFTIPGPKMIWQFEELGYDVSIDEPCRVCEKPIKWNYFEEENRKNLYLYFKTFINLKKNNEVFSTDNFTLNLTGSLKQITLLHNSMNVVIYGNFGLEDKTGSPNLSSSSIWYDYYTQQEYNSSSSFTLAPGEYKILTSMKLDLPDIPEIQVIPIASNVKIIGNLEVGKTLHATYDFFDKNDDTEGQSKYQWYTAEAANRAGTETIEGANDTTYILTSAEEGKYIMFEVTPVANSLLKPIGIAKRSNYTSIVTQYSDKLFIKPTVVIDEITIEKLNIYELIQIFDIQGNIVFELIPENNKNINLSFLRPGIYIIKTYQKGEVETMKIMKM